MKRFLLLALCACLLVFSGFAMAEEESIWEEEPRREIVMSDVVASLPVSGGHAEVRGTSIDGVIRLFLPSFADADTMTLTVNGEPAAWENRAQDGGQWTGEIVNAAGDVLYELRAMCSANLRALFLYSDDPVHQGRAYIDGGEKHSTETTGSMAIVSAEGVVDHAGKLRQLRGRGNYTWTREKKPYQFKLEDRADLLKTGDRSERNRTWVLLAEMADSTFLHNRIAMDLGLEMGIEATSHSEHVDLYYDGEYRGLYLLAEKVEVGEGRLDVLDYDKMMEDWNAKAGIPDMEALPVEYSHNRFDNMFSYIKDVKGTEDPAAGSCFLEMEHEVNTLSDRCWFRMSDGSVLASKNPENASLAMMTYISERLEEARRTLKAGGVNPENGRTIEDDFNVEAFARLMLVNEMCYNADSYSYSSSWFILPAGESRFEPGVPWDFDVGMRYRRDGLNGMGAGVKTITGWVADFYNCDLFMETVQRLYQAELKPAVQNILLGTQEGRYLKPLDAYVEEIDAARRMDNELWDFEVFASYLYAEDFESEIEMLRKFLTERFAWLDQAIPAASPYTADVITLWGRANYMHVDGDLQLFACPWNNVDVVSYTWEQLTEADEENYALWELEAFIAPKEGYAFNEPEITFLNTPLTYEEQEDGTLRILVQFEDPSYRPVDYYGEDAGTFYNEEVYRQNYPEISAEYEDSFELLEYFCDEGMYEDQMGNAFFKPSEILHHNPELLGVLGTDWQLYYWEFPYYGHEDGWLLRGGGRGFGLQVTDALK